MKLDWNNIERPILALSPMADMTDSAYCQIVRNVVNGSIPQSRLIVFREMVSSEAVVRGNEKTLGMTEIHPAERPLVQQIFGSNPDVMARAASFIQENYSPEGIDINMGCPVYKITHNFNGSALMKDPDLAVSIVKAMKKTITVPLSVKMRAGWSDHNECIEFAKIIEDAGADLITVHGRTKKQGYSGLSNREVVAKVKQSVSIPVLYNGDVFTWQDYFEALEQTKCDGVLIARGGLGNPWIFKQIEQKLAGQIPDEVSLEERIKVTIEHLDQHLAQYGQDRLPTFRKHISWYLKGLSGFKPYKQIIMTAKDRDTVVKTLEQFLHDQPLTSKA
ncbi:tRNA dihydrouridine synthase DusB [Candidatus Uhrbacteria bacterium]|jgi:tRNA-dihydrouridine synthase B|nr:tRNA dihydrouridine synthase DusB [Candidatus Uhrbacteria bacterium]